MTIKNAKDNPVSASASNMPDVSDALMGWLQPLTAQRMQKQVVNHVVTEIPLCISIRAVVQPLSPTQLLMKPEGQRTWVWKMLHCPNDNPVLQPDDRIIIAGVKFRVMGIYPYELDGYRQYDCCQDYQNCP